jgi:hypothetical protein
MFKFSREAAQAFEQRNGVMPCFQYRYVPGDDTSPYVLDGADHDEAVKLGLPEQVTQDDWPELVTAGVDAGIEIVLDDKI